MEVLDPTEHPQHRHKWLERVGLEAEPSDPETWVAVARGMQIDDFKAQSSDEAAGLVDRLGEAGIEARQCAYEFDTTRGVSGSEVIGGLVSGGKVERVAVLVHHKDRVRATEIAAALVGEQERELRDPRLDDELTREAMEAGPPPDD